MGAQSDALAEHIRNEREELGRDLRELESIVRERPRKWLDENLPRIVAVAFGAFFLIGLVGASRREKRY